MYPPQAIFNNVLDEDNFSVISISLVTMVFTRKPKMWEQIASYFARTQNQGQKIEQNLPLSSSNSTKMVIAVYKFSKTCGGNVLP